MSEEQNEGTWSSLKKTIVGTIATVITGAGAWLGTTMFGGGDAAQPAAPAQPSIIINNTQQQQQQAAAKTIIVKEKADNSSEKVKPKADEKKDEWAKEEPKW
jgi:hypothetical protein